MKRSAVLAFGVLFFLPVLALAVTVNWNYTPPAAVAEGAPYVVSVTPTVSGGYFDGNVVILVFYGTGSTYTTHTMTKSGSTYTFTIPGNRIAFPTLKFQFGCDMVYDTAHGWWESLYSDMWQVPVGAYIVASAGSNGSISPNGSVSFSLGENKTFTITPASAAYEVDTVTVDGASVGSPTTYTFYNLLNGHSIHATFKLKTFTVVPYAGTGGTISPGTTQTVNYGGSSSFTITPSTGYEISDVQVNDVSVGAVGSHTISSITQNTSIDAYFTLKQYAISTSVTGNGSVSPVGPVSVTHGSDQTFSFTPDEGYRVSDVLIDGMSQGAIASYTFTNVTAAHSVAVTFVLKTYTVTVASGTGGSTDKNGSQTVNHGSNITITPTADTGYHFSAWSGDNTSSTAPLTLTVTSDLAITANFAINQYTVTVSSDANGSTDKNGSNTVNHGDSITITPTPNTGYHFSAWSGDNTGTTAPLTLTVTGNLSITANFAINQYTVTVASDANGSTDKNGSNTVNHGDSITITPTPNTGYHFSAWSGDNTGTTAPLTLTVTGNLSITANFAINQYTVTVTSDATGSTDRNGANTVNHGSTITITPTANTGYHFNGWSGDATGSANPLTLTVTGNVSVHATFAINQYTVTVASGANGSTDKNGSHTINHGDSITITPTANTGYHFAGWTGDASGTTSPLTLTVTGNLSVTATFAINQYTVTVASGANGSTDRNGSHTINHGDSITITPTANTGYHFDTWSGDATGTSNPLTLTVTSSLSVQANFAINQYTVTVASSGGGSTDKDGTQTVDHGASFVITPTAADGKHFVSWSGDASGSDNPLTLTVTGALSITANFATNQYSVTVTSGPHGSTNRNGTHTVNHGDSFVITPTPDTGYHFSGWSGDNTSTDNPLTLTVTSSLSVQANFTPGKHTVTVTAVTGGTTDRTGSTSVDYGSSFTVTATPSADYSFTGWTGDASGTANPLTVTVTGDMNIAAGFAIKAGKLTVSIDPASIRPVAAWKANGGDWHAHGEVIELAPGAATVEYMPVDGWITPAQQSVEVVAGSQNSTIGTYQAATGSLVVTLTPAEAVYLGAAWRLDGGAWQNSGQTRADLAPGKHVVTFMGVEGWNEPAALNVTIVAGGTTAASAAYQKKPGPVIHYFTASVGTAAPGDTVELRWMVSDANAVSISPDIGDGLPASGTRSVVIQAATTWYLTATNSNGETTAEVQVTALARPQILWFLARTPVITRGSEATLTFAVQGAAITRVAFAGEAGATVYEGNDSVADIRINLMQNTTLNLSATNASGTVTGQVRVEVVELPTIRSFTAQPQSIAEGGSTALAWEVAGAQQVKIMPGGFVNAGTSGTTTVSPTQTTVYTLTAENQAGSVESTVSVSVEPAVRTADLSVAFDAAAAALPGTVQMGASLQVPVIVSNDGPADAADVAIELSENGLVLSRSIVKSLKAGKQAMIAFSYRPTRTGKSTLRIVADPQGQVPDPVRSNNTLTQRLTAEAAAGVDLAVTRLQVNRSPQERCYEVDVVIVNAGSLQSDGFQYVVELRNARGEVVGVLLVDRSEGLAPGASIDVRLPLRTGLKRFSVVARVDVYGAVTETDEGNNSMTCAVVTSLLP